MSDVLSPALIILLGAVVASVGFAMGVPQGCPRYSVLLGACVVAVGGFWQARDQHNYNNTGGKSFCYLKPGFDVSIDARHRGLPDMWLWHSGKHPLYDLHLRVVDLQKLAQLLGKRPQPPLPMEKLAKAEKYYQVDRLDPGFGQIMGKWKLPDGVDEQSYNVFVTTRSGNWVQEIRFRRIDGQWQTAIRVTRADQVLKEEGNQYLPKDDSGHGKW